MSVGTLSHVVAHTQLHSTLVELEFNSPVNTIKVMWSQSVYLGTPFLGRLSPLSS